MTSIHYEGHGQFVRSACGHPQEPPTAQEIAGCPEIIVRRCIVCERELYWHAYEWLLIARNQANP